MADEADNANDVVQRSIDATMRTVNTSNEVEANGACLLDHCEMPLPVGRRWCDADCRDAWEKDKRRSPHD